VPQGPLSGHEPSSGATPSTQLTRHGQVLGTPAYMSVEQARGEPAAEKSDVYALGAMLYQLLTGRRPYLQPDATSTLRAILAGPPSPIAEVAPGIAPELASVVERAMARGEGGPAAAPADAASLEPRLRELLAQHQGNLSAVAAALGKDRVQIRRWMKKLGLDAASFREGGRSEE
jgi:serine/threonine protein kinase